MFINMSACCNFFYLLKTIQTFGQIYFMVLRAFKGFFGKFKYFGKFFLIIRFGPVVIFWSELNSFIGDIWTYVGHISSLFGLIRNFGWVNLDNGSSLLRMELLTVVKKGFWENTFFERFLLACLFLRGLFRPLGGTESVVLPRNIRVLPL